MERFNTLIKANFKQQRHEIAFVLLCACNEPDNKRSRRLIEMASNTSLNWDLIAEISIKQRVLPLIYKNIKTFLPDKVQEHALKRMKNLNFNTATRNLYLFSILLKILDLFDENNIPVIPFKGPILAQDAYYDMGLRPFSDLDILVSKKSVLKAWALLIKKGFRPQLELKDTQKQSYMKSEDHMAFFKDSICVELHWEMSGLYLSHPLTYEHVKNRLRKVSGNGRIISNLSVEDLIVYLCVHGTKHGWVHLEQICCIAELIKSSKTLDWVLVEKLAAERKCQKMLWLGLYLSFFICRISLPASLLNKIKKNSSILKFTNEVIICLFSESASGKVKNISDRFSSFHLRIRDSLIDKIRYALRLTFRSTDKEWLYFPVPARLSFLHYALRPCRLLITKLRGEHA